MSASLHKVCISDFVQIVRKNSNAACCASQTLLGLLYRELWCLHLILPRSARVPRWHIQPGWIYLLQGGGQPSLGFMFVPFRVGLGERWNSAGGQAEGEGGGKKDIWVWWNHDQKCSGSALLQYGGAAPVDDIASPPREGMSQIPLEFFLIIFCCCFCSREIVNYGFHHDHVIISLCMGNHRSEISTPLCKQAARAHF